MTNARGRRVTILDLAIRQNRFKQITTDTSPAIVTNAFAGCQGAGLVARMGAGRGIRIGGHRSRRGSAVFVIGRRLRFISEEPSGRYLKINIAFFVDGHRGCSRKGRKSKE